MSLQRRRTPRSVQSNLLRTRLRPDLPSRPENPAHVILGVSATGDTDMAATLAAEWLTNVFGQVFTELRTGESSLGVVAFYDALSYPIGDRAFVGVIGLDENSASRAASTSAASSLHAERSEPADAVDPITLHFEGIAHALFNRASGHALVMFDRLPGAIELVSEPKLARHAAAGAPRAEALAWYGFGTVERHQPRVRRALRSGISHGIVAGELKSLLAEYV